MDGLQQKVNKSRQYTSATFNTQFCKMSVGASKWQAESDIKFDKLIMKQTRLHQTQPDIVTLSESYNSQCIHPFIKSHMYIHWYQCDKSAEAHHPCENVANCKTIKQGLLD